MDETIKSRIILILLLLTLIFFVSMVFSCTNAQWQKAASDKEMISRLDSEERLFESERGKTALEKQLSSLSKELEEEKAGHEAAVKALAEQQGINQDLKEELQKVTKLKEALEEDLKEALVAKVTSRSVNK